MRSLRTTCSRWSRACCSPIRIWGPWPPCRRRWPRALDQHLSPARRSSSSGQDKRAAHFYRDLNPCVYHRGTLLVAPSDSEYILALDAGTGQILWESHLAADAVHLLGVGGGNLIASGDRLWWLDVETGKVVARWPEQSPTGYGRGILAGNKIYWPTRDALYEFDQQVKVPGQAPLVRDPILLAADKNRQAGGGNLVIAQGVMLIAGANKLYAFGRPPAAPAAAARTEKAAQR